jgi:hypothetical protein
MGRQLDRIRKVSTPMAVNSVGEKLGRIFEIGFNVGLLEDLGKRNLCPQLVARYRPNLEKLVFPRLVRRLLESEEIVGSEDSAMLEKWVLYYLARGFLAGRSFLTEYLTTLGWNKTDKLEVIYYQANFTGDNSLGLNPKSQSQFATEMLIQFGLQLEQVDWERYSCKGEFLRADTLLLLSYRRKKFRLLALDLSVFSVQEMHDLADLENVEVLRRQLIKELSYLKSKSIFANLNLDTGAFNLSRDLANYFTAFKRQDKETAKLIQAASYGHSFYRFLEEYNLLPADVTRPIVNVIGYSDRGMSALAVTPENFDLLETCAHIYKHPVSAETISEARHRVLTTTQRNAARSFQNGRDFLKQLLNVPTGQLTLVSHTEQIMGFTGTETWLESHTLQELGVTAGLSDGMSLRNAHAALIRQALENAQENFLFLTGNPGIGKTTTIIDFLRDHIEEGFLFLYASPRKQVNLDVIHKFRVENGEQLCDDRLLGLNTNADIIRANGGQLTVQYLSNNLSGNRSIGGVTFLDSKQATVASSVDSGQHGLKRILEDTLEDGSGQGAGVLSSICEAIHAALSAEVSNNLIATASIQALKRTSHGEDTLKHFGKIFKGAYQERDNRVLPDRMRELSRRVKHLFIMVDEITGDDSGVAFLNRLTELLEKYELLQGQHGFNTKVIVADASIVDAEVISRHLQESGKENSVEPDKIFFRQANNRPEVETALARNSFNFGLYPATLINANSYPASRLDITYNVFIESYRHTPKAALHEPFGLINNIQNKILQDINTLLDQDGAGQVLVYIQDKRRLSELITRLDKLRGGFKEQLDYLSVHADLSDNQKKQVQAQANEVRVVFMTASASRGLSFPRATHILVDVPRFQVENNLMEIIQVIYRGRGGYLDKISGQRVTFDNDPRQLIFYLGEQVAYYSDDEVDAQTSLQEGVLSLVNMLLVLKTSIMTRIQGYGKIGPDRYLMIPIGGKAVSAAGETFANRMANLIRELEKQQQLGRHDDRLLKHLYTQLRQLLSSSEVLLTQSDRKRQEQNFRSFLSLRRQFVEEFSRAIQNGLDKLLDFEAVEFGYIQGSLLIVPLRGKQVQENYLMRLAHELETWFNNPNLSAKIQAIIYDSTYPESLRYALRDAQSFIARLSQRKDKTQWLVQRSQRDDLYYALPLFAFISAEALAEYYAGEPQEPEDIAFKDLLSQYVRTLFPVEGLLPIGTSYGEFPFVMFKSYSLPEIRSKAFTEKYLLTSRELNMLNLILSQEDK